MALLLQETGMKKEILLVDSHAHLDMEEFNPDREEVLRRAVEAGVHTVLCPAELTDSKSLDIILGLTEKSAVVAAAAGVHPHQAKKFQEDCLDTLRRLAAAKKILAVGEIGLDYHYDFSPRHQQQESLRRQINLARELSLPVVIHSRNSGPDIIAAVQEERLERGGVLHCFTEDWSVARAMLDFGFLISFSGILTFPNAFSLREIAKKLPLERILVETDSPYLVPSSLKGKTKRNEPAFVTVTAEALAGLKGLLLEDLARHIVQNFETMFRFEKKDRSMLR